MEPLDRTEVDLQEILKRLKEVDPRLGSLEREIELLKDLGSSILLSVVNLKDSVKLLAEGRQEDREFLRRLAEEFLRDREVLRSLAEEVREDRKFLIRLAEEAEKDREMVRRLVEGREEDREWLRELEEKAERDREWMRRKWGEMAQRLGTLTEDIFAPGIPYLIERLGYRVKERMLDVEYEKDGRRRQYDALVIAEDEVRREVLFVAEVKSQARSEDFEQLRSLVADLLWFKPEFASKRIVPLLAAFRIPPDLVNLANKRRILLVRMGGEYLEPLNPEVVKA